MRVRELIDALGREDLEMEVVVYDHTGNVGRVTHLTVVEVQSIRTGRIVVEDGLALTAGEVPE